MPSYKNSGSTVVECNGMRIEPGETVQMQSYIPTSFLKAGVTLVSDEPFWNTTVLSSNYTGDTAEQDIVAIPAIVNGNVIRGVKGTIYCSSGSVEITFNSDSNLPKIALSEGFTYGVSTIERNINDIRLTYTADGSIVTIDLRLP